MTDRPALELVLLWHMHQPDYRDSLSGEVLEPWTWLHALKDYSDMAAHLERHPAVRAVVNFTPVLLDQLDALAAECRDGSPREPLARLLVHPEPDRIDHADRRWLLERAFRCNHATMLTPFAGYVELRRIRESFGADLDGAARYLGGQYFADLVTWYHLAWTGETVRRGSPLVLRLMARGSDFTTAERQALFAEFGDLVAGLPGRYRRLAERGQVELSTTPYAHPLGPLLFDFASAQEAIPQAPLPTEGGYPGGAARFDRHVQGALARHTEAFGTPAAGMWPAEGGVSDAVLAHLSAAGVRWAMTGEAVLANSVSAAGGGIPRETFLSRPVRFDAAPGLAMLFRDDELSDLIGFEYARWHGREAALDFVARLERRREHVAGQITRPIVVVALDGENAWEHFPYNGYYFFEELYGQLADHPSIRTTTPSAFLARHEPEALHLPHIVAGSWVYGTLSTWIGDPAKNAAWDRLVRAKRMVDAQPDRMDPALDRQLMLAESSDWFWWLGEGTAGHGPRTFDRLARHNLANLYRLLGVPIPHDLVDAYVVDADDANPADNVGAMRRAHAGH